MPDTFTVTLNTTRGMNAGIEPAILPFDQYAKGVNLTSRGGLPRTRPVFTELTLTDAVDPSSLFTTGLFQGAELYRLNSVDRIIVGIAGKVLGINTSDLSVIDYTALAGTTMDATVSRLYGVQADKFFIVQDGINPPIIIDGATARTPAADEVPIGTKMAYGHGRLFVVTSTVQAVSNLGERFILAGDVILPNDVDNLLKFTEIDYLNGGGAISLPNELGFITAMSFLRNIASGSGLGPLIVLAEGGASAFGVNAPRAQWQDIDLSQVLFIESGSKSPFSFTPVNNDLLYRSIDGIRTIGYSTSVARSGAGGMANDPISNEVFKDILDQDTEADQFFTPTASVNNRFFTGAIGDSNQYGHFFQSIISLDTSLVPDFGGADRPIYDGIWTGLNFTELTKARLNNVETLFVFAKDSTNGNKLYYLDESGYQDGTSSRPVVRLYTRGISGAEEIAQLVKRFLYAEMWLTDIVGEVTAKVYYRPLGYPLWNETLSMTASADPTGLPQRRRKFRLAVDERPNDSSTGDCLDVDTDFQFCIEIIGHARHQKTIFHFNDQSELNTQGSEISSSEVKLEEGDSGVILDDLEYNIV